MIELTRISSPRLRMDGRILLPRNLQGLSREAILALPLPTETLPLRLAEAFSVQIRPGHDDAVCIRGDCSLIDNIGYGLDRGALVLVGDAGDYFGALQEGGVLVVTGSVGSYACTAMKQGTVCIGGDCGQRLASPLPGERAGMRGGDIFVAGQVGERACERMRRGSVLIAGNVGGTLAPNMIAGTLMAMGQVGPGWGLGMKRGTIVFTRDPESESAAMMTPNRDLELSFLPLVWNHMRSVQTDVANLCSSLGNLPYHPIPIPTTRWVSRRIADLSVGGRGEILVLRRLTSVPGNEPTLEHSPTEDER